MDERYTLSSPKKRGLGFPKNYGGRTLTVIAALLLNRNLPEIKKIMREKQNSFGRNRPRLNIFWQFIELSKDNKQIILKLHVIRFLQGIQFHTQKKGGANVTNIWPSQRNYCYNDALQKHKTMVRSPDGDTNFFNIIAGVLQGDTLTP